MAGFEYKVVPAPTKGAKAKGVKTPEARFSLSVEQMLNTYGAQGWEYQRTDTLPSTERSGLTGSQNVWRHVLIFRRPLTLTEAESPQSARPPLKIEHQTLEPAEDVVETGPETSPETVPETDAPETDSQHAPEPSHEEDPERAAEAQNTPAKTLKSPFDSEG